MQVTSWYLVPQSCPGGTLSRSSGRGQSLPCIAGFAGIFFLIRPSQDAPPVTPEGVLLPSMIDTFSDSDLGTPMAYAQCELIPGSDTPMSLPVFSVPSGFSARPDQSSIQTVLTLETSSHPDGGSSATAPPMDDQLGKEQAMAAAVNLQRDTGIMLSKLQILSQFAMSLSRMSSEIMDLGIGQMVFPHDEVAGLSPAPRAAKYMSAMGLWRPQMGPGDLGPVPDSTCRSMTCDYCFPEDQLPPE